MTTTASEPIRVGSLTIRFRLEGAESNGGLAMFEFDVPTGGQPPAPHSHDGYEETVYGLAGVLTWTIDGRTVETGPGDVVCIPRGAVHRFENLAEEEARALAVVTPGVLGPDFFRELGLVLDGGGPPYRARVGEVMRRHGLTPA
jgi:quercetin dioxygenase-like cupin family protein